IQWGTKRLANGTGRCSGRVEVFHDGQWGTVCDDMWDIHEAEVVCRAMDCGSAQMVTFSAFFGQGDGNIWLDDLNFCNVKLMDGPNRCAGRVEVYKNGQWGNVCGESWDLNDASVVCQQLKCGKEHRISTAPDYGHGSGQVWVEQIECSGRETAISQCPQNPFVDRTCNITSLAGLVCSDSLNVRLAEGSDACSGRVEVLSGAVWATVCDVDWTLEKAEVVCETIECGYAVNAPGEAHFNPGTGLVIDSINPCFTNKTNLQNCVKNGFKTSTCGHERDAGVVCAGIESSFIFTFLLQSRNVSHIKSYVQNITLTSPHAMLIYSPEKLSIKKGDYFFITCSVHSTYPGGYFYLTKSNTSRSEPKAAFGHSIFYMANFEFPSIQYEHQGLYSCVYAMNISSQSFFSDESKTIQVTVVGECLI
uniref:Soluble scavenger receptor cysteine-rich domain-containing protein SSC5D n=1 Tax=Periophthalmus magnuspinnatus TaxID=409849 RepID=A0A3B4B1B7_9GOBI